MSKRNYPAIWQRLFSVWFRHVRVYGQNLISNGFPPFLEPLMFLAGVGLGLQNYIHEMDHLPYLTFLATGLLVTTAMFTSAFECSFGTFIRLEFDKVYDGMLAAPITVNNLIVGEIIWAGTKGLFFSFSVLVIMTAFGIIPLPWSLLAPLVGFATGVMFATISLLITAFVKNINHFNFYFSGFISPMFFFSGVIFPISDLPRYLRPFCEILPLTHSVRLVRAACLADFHWFHLLDLLFIVVFTAITGPLAIRLLRKRLIK